MPKIKKVRRSKKFNFNRNRKRLRNKITKVNKISCKEIADNFERHKSFQTNLLEMGLSVDPNKSIKIDTRKKIEVKPKTKTTNSDWFVEEADPIEEVNLSKKVVAEKLLQDAKAPRIKGLRLPGSVVEWVTYLMDTYGSDYKAMARDKKNRDQETWKQLRRTIKLFKSIEEQYSQYLKQRGIEKPIDSDLSSDGEL